MTKHPKEAERLKKIVKSFPNVTIAVVGDLVADEFIFGEISRVSREAPVLILGDLFVNEEVFHWSDVCEDAGLPHVYTLAMIIDPEKMNLAVC